MLSLPFTIIPLRYTKEPGRPLSLTVHCCRDGSQALCTDHACLDKASSGFLNETEHLCTLDCEDPKFYMKLRGLLPIDIAVVRMVSGIQLVAALSTSHIKRAYR